MPTYQVTCISRDGPDPDYRIDAVGVDGVPWQIDQAIAWLHTSDENKLYVSDDNGTSVWVVTREHPQSRRWYLTTYPDGILLNNLESLPECP